MNMPAWLAGFREELNHRLEGQSLPHALLLLGRSGLGKRALAHWLCQRALCGQAAAGDPCGRCRSCELFTAGTHPDFFSCQPPEGKQQITVDQIRDLIARASLTRSQSDHQVFLIEQAERINRHAANAFLKTLEEPTPGTLLILLAERRDALPATVTSRCQVFEIRTPARAQAIAWLRQDGLALADEQLAGALAAAGEAPGVARDLIVAGLHDEKAVVGENLAAVAEGRQDVAAVAARWADQHLHHRLRWMADLLNALVWHRLSVPRLGAEFDALGRLTAGADLATLFACYHRISVCRRMLNGSLRPELLVEDLLLTWRRAAAPR